MSKQFINEVSRMKDLFGYKKGQVISEQDFKPFNPNGSYPSLGIGGQNNLTQKQKEASAAGFGPVTDEQAKELEREGKLKPKPVKGSTKEEYPECVKVFGNPKASQSGKEFSIIGTGDYKDFFFFPNGFYGNFSNTSSKPPHGKYSCKGNVIVIGPLDSEKIVTPVKPKPVIQIPKELKDAEGVKKFQDWLDSTIDGWLGKPGVKLNKDKGKGYGNFGSKTQAAWDKYKNRYALNNARPGVTDADAPVDDTQTKNYASIPPADDSDIPDLMFNDNAPKRKF
jgi:hypothetical protein